MYKIYKHTCKVNGKSYIGQTSSTDIKNDRWQNGAGYKQCTVFYRAIKKYGWDNFTHEIIEDNIETLAQANEREHYWIMYYHTWIDDPECNGYNSTAGGNNFISEEVKAKISKSLQGHSVSEEARKIYSENLKNSSMYKYWQGKKRSAETVEKLRQAKLGTIETEEQRAKIAESLLKFYSSDAASTVRKDGTKLATPVRCVETGEIFFSVNEAARQKSPKHNANGAGHIKDCLKGKRHKAFGYHWEYVD